MSKPGRLGVGIISAGKVGAVIGAALRAAEHQIVGVHAVSEASRERAENLLPEVPVLEIDDILRRAELIVFAVPDDQLGPLVQGLADGGHFKPGHLVLHTAGRFGLEVLEPARAAGAIGLAIHPAMTFTGLSLDLGRLADCVFGVTAEAMMLPIAQALVVEMGAEPVVIKDADRPLYHAALAHASNHLVTLTGQSAQLLGRLGVERPDRILGPLMRASLENALAAGEDALTGPVARGDSGTVAEHAAALTEEDDGVARAYAAMARATAERAAARGRITQAQAQEIARLLGA
ncbi:Rossmann-like and DUF2520 domain-containing protein [Zhihengliuella flava]|uniref:Short-subunit dehydrogenase-like oxidoreductase (DUF2520 family) n=1 Tax=Zhihengliuella flava TaxID=1285193 RepID=A0A931DDI0_9MICC|nr:DUF2520 domain-containing protein [Zhihengliuella flava]MBG6084818.1 putative short-subunit dehydrogenase-like oxidoreductase (DUF2520 family) [Zhihengliuella flava]